MYSYETVSEFPVINNKISDKLLEAWNYLLNNNLFTEKQLRNHDKLDIIAEYVWARRDELFKKDVIPHNIEESENERHYKYDIYDEQLFEKDNLFCTGWDHGRHIPITYNEFN